ncbi:MAG: GAF domain-containing protein [Proteobacteria bacterium]|nr:GAF domain-containing protein [Pseudomonadota bacterium]
MLAFDISSCLNDNPLKPILNEKNVMGETKTNQESASKSGRSHEPLAKEALELLSMAALFAGEFSIDWLMELSGMKASKVLTVLKKRIAAGEIVEKDSGMFHFSTDEVRRKLLDFLEPDRKEQLHRQAVQILSEEASGDSGMPQTLSKHLLHVTNDTEGCRWLINAGDLFNREAANTESLECYTKAINDLRCIKEKAADRLFIEAVEKYLNVVTARYDSEWTTAVLEDGLSRAEAMNDKSSQALLKMHLSANLWQRKEPKLSWQHYEQGWAIAQEVDDPRTLRPITIISAYYHNWQGRYRDTVKIFETSVQDVEKFPNRMFPLYASTTVAASYAAIGQVNQALGMLDAISAHCIQNKRYTIAGYAIQNMGRILLSIGRIEDVYQYFVEREGELEQTDDSRLKRGAVLLQAYTFHLKNENERSVECLKRYLEILEEGNLMVWPSEYRLALCWAAELGRYPEIENLSLEKEIELAVDGGNILTKGIGYRYRSLLQKRQGAPPKEVLKSLNQSLRWLKESGSVLSIAETEIEMARAHLSLGDEKKARTAAKKAANTIMAYPDLNFPDDLRFLIKDISLGENLLEEILQLGQDVVTIRSNKDLVKHIVLTINRITGAERGAIFLLEKESSPPEFVLRAAKNLTAEDINQPDFAASMDIIREVTATGQGVIRKMNLEENINFNTAYVRSCVCVPMTIKNEIVGVLYHDNRFLSSAFKETDLKMFTYFAALAAIAMDNARAYDQVQGLNRKLRQEKQYYREQHLESLHFDNFIGESPAIKEVLGKVAQVADTNTTVLIHGETGVGKELIAGNILDLSSRREKPFIRVNCSAFSESLIASELFGHEKGAFTGANERRAGRFELADGGTLFLDEIGDIPMEVQVRLLRVLQNQEFERVGGTKTLHSDFRLITATNQSLQKLVRTGKFREDLYFRLNVFPIHVPPLRKRREDIPLLALYFLKIFAKKTSKPFAKILESEMEKLLKYEWPGNVRELENVIERGVVMSPRSSFRVPELNSGEQASSYQNTGTTLAEMEKQHILWALDKTGWKIRGPGGTAELLEIHYSTLRSRMKKHGIQRETATA